MVLTAVAQNRDAVNHMHEALFDDREFMLACAAANKVRRTTSLLSVPLSLFAGLSTLRYGLIMSHFFTALCNRIYLVLPLPHVLL